LQGAADTDFGPALGVNGVRLAFNVLWPTLFLRSHHAQNL
jgi:hypothetical protein